jgi:2-iminobutanoate/2-iminopropanoate deaminase
MKKIVRTAQAPAPIGPYNQAVEHNGLLFISGQIALDPVTGELVRGDVRDEARQVMKNLEAILAEAGLGFEHVLKTGIFLTDMHHFAAVNEVYGAYFDDHTAPARETVAVAALPRFVNVEISMIAARP